MGSAFDTLISTAAILGFVFFVGAKIYSHEKEHLDPIIDKVKSWFVQKEGEEESYGPNEDFDLEFRGQLRD